MTKARFLAVDPDEQVAVAEIVDQSYFSDGVSAGELMRFRKLGTTPFTYEFPTGKEIWLTTWEADDRRPSMIQKGYVQAPAEGVATTVRISPPSGPLWLTSLFGVIFGGISAGMGALSFAMYRDDAGMYSGPPKPVEERCGMFNCYLAAGLAGGGALAVVLGIVGISSGKGSVEYAVDEELEMQASDRAE